ncbi:MAG: hypothetical protein QOC60_1032 [Frankiaceae bacterium]|nr:hypothetical protein [Frankiaceae bacterium]
MTAVSRVTVDPAGAARRDTAAGPRVVALGGGHGVSAALSALRLVTDHLTAVVTVADDGGSSGRLRKEFPGLLPPGDLRMALAALAGETDDHVWRQLVQHRFGGDGELAGHAVGNLLISALSQLYGDPVLALDTVNALLGGPGRVLPMSTVPLDIVAEVMGAGADPKEITQVRGQHAVATTSGRVMGVHLLPDNPPACPQAVAAIAAAEWVVLGPGSWFTSVLPHLLVPDLAAALATTAARRVVVLNLAAQPGETKGFSPEAHLDVLEAYASGVRIDVVVADVSHVPDPHGLMSVARDLGAEVVLAPVAREDGSPRHDAVRLADVFARFMGGRH